MICFCCVHAPHSATSIDKMIMQLDFTWNNQTLKPSIFYITSRPQRTILSCMAKLSFLSKTLLWCLVFVLVSASANGVTKNLISVNKFISFPEFSISVNPRIEHDVKLLGSAKLSDDKQSIQIPDTSETDDIRHQAGRAIYSSPIRVFDPNSQTPGSFDTTFAFQFCNHSSPANHDSTGETHGGSGLTFLIAPDEFTVGRPGPWLGMLNDACDENYYKFFAVEFDTHQNPEFGDPNDNHIGINLGSIISSSTINASDYGLNFADGSIHHARITYDGSNKRMDIRVGSSHKGPLRSVFSDDIDLSPFLNEYMFVGFSASTGNRTQLHNILSWNFTSKTPSNLRLPTAETCQSKLLVGRNPVEETKNGLAIKEKRPSTTFVIFICVVILCFVIVVCLYCNSNRPSSVGESTFLDMSEKKHRPQPPNKPRRFTFPELSLATKGFNEWEVIGSDSSGVLFKGTLTNGCHVAVKRFSVQFLSSLGIDKKKFMKRVGSLSRVRHPSLVPIRGWCNDKKELMVVYEYIFNGCLDKWLFGVGVLPWSRRYKVVKNVANGLTHLHSHELAHSNLQVSSVLLDVSFKALIGDFGLGDPVDIDPTSSRSVDIFNFGIFVLEVVAGRKRRVTDMDLRGSGLGSDDPTMMKMDLVDYAWIMHEKDEKIKMVDRRMGSGVDSEQAVRVINIALLCTLPENNGRPKMEEIVTFLSKDCDIPELPPNRPIVLFPYNSGPKLCGGYVCAPFN